MGVAFFTAQFQVQLVTQLIDRIKGQIRVNRFRSVAGQSAEMVNFARLSGFYHQTG